MTKAADVPDGASSTEGVASSEPVDAALVLLADGAVAQRARLETAAR